jgi:fatty acid desaturase
MAQPDLPVSYSQRGVEARQCARTRLDYCRITDCHAHVVFDLIWGVIESDALKLASISMWIANALVPMVGIWSVHVGCESHEHWVARTSRWQWMNQVFAHMLFHLEHHLYPAVPARQLHVLAARLDQAAQVPVPLVHPQLARSAAVTGKRDARIAVVMR